MSVGWDKREAGFFVLALVWLAVTLGARPLALPDEGRYVSVAWEMLTSGNWLYPTLNGLPFFHKPPLFYWITATSLSIFGPHEWAARIASLIGAGIAAFTLYGFTLRRNGKVNARWALLILVTQPFFFAGAQFANLDMLVAGCISATIFLAAEASLNALGNKPYRGFLAAAYFSAAMGVLAKGLIGIVLPGLVIVIWLAWNRRLMLMRQLLWLPGLALFGAIAVPWFVAMQERFPDFLNYFFVYNHFQRFTESGFNNPMPFWFYLPVILVLTLPWSMWLPGAWKHHQIGSGTTPTIQSLMWIWPAVIVGFFSIPSSKLVGYILPALPPLAYLIAGVLQHKWGNSNELPRSLKSFAAVAILICLSAILANNIFNTKSNKQLAGLIAARREAGEPVVFLKNQFFDLPFYLRLREPVRIVDEWDQAKIHQHDDWRKALYDAGTFDPVKARTLLIDHSRLAQALCAQPSAWVVAQKGGEQEYPFLQHTTQVATQGFATVWKVSQADMAASGLCPETPIVGSIDR
jgi:4-amino-4-deoxy-L-arabinose transferase-like glycosyltransferase